MFYLEYWLIAMTATAEALFSEAHILNVIKYTWNYSFTEFADDARATQADRDY